MEALIPDQVKSIHEIMNNETPGLPKPGLGSTASELEQSIHVCASQKEKHLPPGAWVQSGGDGRRGFYTLSSPQGPEAKELW